MLIAKLNMKVISSNVSKKTTELKIISAKPTKFPKYFFSNISKMKDVSEFVNFSRKVFEIL